MTPTLADAALDLRVALADAKRNYEKAVAQAAGDAARAELAAHARWRAACARAREAADRRRSIRAQLKQMDPDALVIAWRRYWAMLGPHYAQHQDRRQKAEVQQFADMISAELRARDMEVTA